MNAKTASTTPTAERGVETNRCGWLRPAWWAWLVPVLLSLWVFWPTLDNRWVLDDHNQIIRNRLIQEPQFYGLALRTDVWSYCDPYARPASNYWRPTFVSWNILNHAAWGLESPRHWHAGNVGLHALVTLLAYVLALRLRLGAIGAVISATLFALHPTRMESVAWVSGSTDILLAFWGMLALLAWVQFVHARRATVRAAYLLGACAAYALALGSKESALGLPLVMGVYAFEQRRRAADSGSVSTLSHALRVVPSLIPLGIVAGVWFFVRLAVLGGLISNAPSATLPETLLSLPSTALWYVRQTVWPYPISPVYLNDVVLLPSLGWREFWRPLAIMVVVVVASALACRFAWRGRAPSGCASLSPTRSTPATGATEQNRRRSPNTAALIGEQPAWCISRADLCTNTLFGLTLFGVVLLPAMNVGGYSLNQPVHDRYLYLPHVGLMMTATAWLMWGIGAWVALGSPPRFRSADRASSRRSLRAGVAHAVVVLGLGAFVAAVGQYNRTIGPLWRDEGSTWSWALRVEPRSSMAHSTLAMVAYNEGRFDDALRHVELADEYTLDKQVEVEEGVPLIKRDTEPSPSPQPSAVPAAPGQGEGPTVRANLLRAQIYLDTGRNREAALEYETFIRVVRASVDERDLSLIRAGLAVAYTRLGRLEEAEKLLRRCKELSPEFSPIIVERLSQAVFRLGRQDEALALLEAELPNVERCHLHGRQLVYYRLGALYYMRGRFGEARTQFEKFLNSTVAIENRSMARYRAETEKALRDLDRLQKGLASTPGGSPGAAPFPSSPTAAPSRP